MTEGQQDIYIEFEDSTDSFETWINKDFVPEDLKSQLSQANVLIIPEEQVRNISGPVFPKGTEFLWRRFERNDVQNLKVEICIGNEYEEYAFHGVDLILIAGFVVQNIVAPVVAMMVYDYIKGRMKKDEDSNAEVRFEMTVVLPDKTSKKIKYKGPASKFDKLIDAVKQVSSENQRDRVEISTLDKK
ncbi:hypothetical protein [Bdellovibrio sp. KM01]|uniref:hypothetical protein n=1 Tax=Bdellovibrio sp. KM01 TaxID=2748865 RepID=UPI0015E9485C|nr:hypothetical protein [Bdellovibrio sp. KM01]QLY25703.1 hypothetical protein HW988_01220 [Bdellovibrio sp. KM01]